MSTPQADRRLIVALDAPTAQAAAGIVDRLGEAVSVYKVGKELFTAEGPRVLEALAGRGKQVFLDLKFHDIPNTVGAACEAAARHGVWMMNVHASGGAEMMRRAADGARRGAEPLGRPRPLVIAVTVLTSLRDEDLRAVGVERPVADQVVALAVLAREAGLDGVVASGREIGPIRRACGKDFVIVTPGVRPEWAAAGDQKRVITPGEAARAGADHLVVGRPITASDDPAAAARRVLAEIGG